MVSKAFFTNSSLIGNCYKIFQDQNIGSGAFGKIYLGINVNTKTKVAIKTESSKAEHPQLNHEASILGYLQGRGMPKCMCYAQGKELNYLVMDLLGPNLESLLNKCRPNFSLKTLTLLSLQMLARINYIHTRHIIHRDIKPDNFLIGKDETKGNVYLIDFGLSKRFRDPKTGLHIPEKDGKSLVGTARYSSIYTHLGIEQSRRDDLEALAYSIIYLGKGSLPWQGIRAKNKNEKYQKILELKINTEIEELCKGLPEEIKLFLQYCRNLHFEEKPDYDYLTKLFTQIMEKNNIIDDKLYDWDYIDTKLIKQPFIFQFKKESNSDDSNKVQKEEDSNLNQKQKDNI